ncbi:MAG TPA: hypothetical protein VHZ95_08605 [Polyangiales bacterium]|nr:hypothetical protein [Polyangiales bacterium]
MSRNESARIRAELRGLIEFVQKLARRSAIASLTIACSASLFACDSKVEERAEARDLLLHLNAVADDRSLTERSSALAELRRLRLHVPEHIRTRDTCHAAHLGLLEAETLQASARHGLAKGERQGGTLSQSDAQAINDDIARSNRALAEAKSQFPACEKATQSLVAKSH